MTGSGSSDTDPESAKTEDVRDPGIAAAAFWTPERWRMVRRQAIRVRDAVRESRYSPFPKVHVILELTDMVLGDTEDYAEGEV